MRHGKSHVQAAGFSLIEVCLALLVVGLGLLTVFSLFPSGLRSGEADTADTRAGLFTESVMNGMRANAMKLTSWADWRNKVTDGVLKSDGGPVRIEWNDPSTVGPITECQFPDVPAGGSAEEEWLRYRLTLDSSRYSAFLEIWDGRYGPTNTPQSTCYTEFW